MNALELYTNISKKYRMDVIGTRTSYYRVIPPATGVYKSNEAFIPLNIEQSQSITENPTRTPMQPNRTNPDRNDTIRQVNNKDRQPE